MQISTIRPARQQAALSCYLRLTSIQHAQPWSMANSRQPKQLLGPSQLCNASDVASTSKALKGEASPVLPCQLQECCHFVNLTNGVEIMPLLSSMSLPYSFCRIQSTALEQKRFEALLSELDSNLLLNLALGKCCLVYDLGSRNKVQGAPKAIWYGLEFIRYALEMLWFRRSEDAFLRGAKCTASFQTYVDQLSNPLTRRLKYYRRFMDPNLQQLQLFGVYKLTQRDSDLAFHRDLVCTWAAQSNPPHHSTARPAPVPGHASAPASVQELERHGYSIFWGGKYHKHWFHEW